MWNALVTLHWHPRRELHGVGDRRVGQRGALGRERGRRRGPGDATQFAGGPMAGQWRGGGGDVRIGQAKGEVEHVVLVVRGLLERVVDMVFEDDVTRRAGDRLLARGCEG